ncbi:methyltransferase domain-containing protein [Streptomyces sp. NPDC001205]
MTTTAARTAGLLAAIGEQLGFAVSAPYADALRAVPRHLFLPDRFWVRDGEGGYRPVERRRDATAWWTAAYSDQPLVTQFTDGAPSSSASMPSMVLYELYLAQIAVLGRRPVRPRPGSAAVPDGQGPRVLELGTGTGFNAGLLCALLGEEAVTTVDVDLALVAQAAANLKTAGYLPTVAVADAATPGTLPHGPFDLILATFSIDRIPDPWRAQLRPGGRIVTPWYSDWTAYGMLTLTTDPDGAARGRFHPHGSYMTMRTPNGPQNTPGLLPGPTATSMGVTRLSPWTVTAGRDTEFHLGLTVPHVSYEWDTSGEHAPIRFALYGADGSSATVDYDGQQSEEFTVTQTGPRALWTETENAYARWAQLGRPAVDRHGLTLTPDGTHHVWIDQPGTVITTLR